MIANPTPTDPRNKLFDRAFVLVALLAGFWFFGSLDRLWPLARVDLHKSRPVLEDQARHFLKERGIDVEGFRAASRLKVEEETLTYLETHLPREAVQALILENLTLVRYQVFFKKPGDARMISVAMHPDGAVSGWVFTQLEETPGAGLEVATAQNLAENAAVAGLGARIADYELKAVQSRDLPNRRSHRFDYERQVLDAPELRERLQTVIEGEEATTVVRGLVVPEPARLARRAHQAPREALQWLGILFLGLAGFVALVVFLKQMQAGNVRLQRALMLAGLVLVCGLLTQFLQGAALFLEWDPLWPQWVSQLRGMVFRAGQSIQIFLLVLILVAAADALDRSEDTERGRDLWRLLKGHWRQADVGLACWRGFLLGLLCGGVMTLAVTLLTAFGDARVAIQPRAFFFYALNASHPALATVFFFLGIALVEELGYRYFGGTWLLRLSGRKWLAVLAPALIYGVTHTGLDFLPPAEPFWARSLVMTLVGCVWGWGFFRYGALCVVVSHFTADLFIFNWPRLASGEPTLVLKAILTIAVPLIPTVAWVLSRSASRANSLLGGTRES